jgi:hypothetical protein
MGKVLDEIGPDLAAWIARQPMFFVATAPSGADGHVNLSPKGLAGLAVLGPHRCAYLDLTGSGVETIAHVRENGRITIMFCAFEGAARIVRFHGRGVVHPLDSAGFDALASEFPELPGRRAIIEIEVTRVSTSCGFGVPRMELVGERDELLKWSDRKDDDELAEYHHTRNATSIDGIPSHLDSEPVS